MNAELTPLRFRCVGGGKTMAQVDLLPRQEEAYADDNSRL